MTIRRATLEKTNDDPMMQTGDFNLRHGEKATGLEHAHAYGLSTVPVAPSKVDGKMRRAEAIVAFPEGDRSHGVALMVSDRRFRPKGMKAGEVQLHDDKKNKVHLAEGGIEAESPKKISLKVGDKGSITIDAAGVITIRGTEIKFEKA